MRASISWIHVEQKYATKATEMFAIEYIMVMKHVTLARDWCPTNSINHVWTMNHCLLDLAKNLQRVQKSGLVPRNTEVMLPSW